MANPMNAMQGAYRGALGNLQGMRFDPAASAQAGSALSTAAQGALGAIAPRPSSVGRIARGMAGPAVGAQMAQQVGQAARSGAGGVLTDEEVRAIVEDQIRRQVSQQMTPSKAAQIGAQLGQQFGNIQPQQMGYNIGRFFKPFAQGMQNIQSGIEQFGEGFRGGAGMNQQQPQQAVPAPRDMSNAEPVPYFGDNYDALRRWAENQKRMQELEQQMGQRPPTSIPVPRQIMPIPDMGGPNGRGMVQPIPRPYNYDVGPIPLPGRGGPQPAFPGGMGTFQDYYNQWMRRQQSIPQRRVPGGRDTQTMQAFLEMFGQPAQ